jgi:cellulose synthase/poly-beta-1,6-N-acetylglucosamine synthase-like glycosyltransferase
LHYPKDLIQIIVIDSASIDNTFAEVQRFVESHPQLNILTLKENDRGGKSRALNLGLKHSTGEVIIVSDADCFWPPDILYKALPYLTDPSVGAIAGQEKLLNPHQSWVTKTESKYREKMFQIQLGESKIHSTIQFEGGFGAYKKELLDEFDRETGADDSGTALNIVQKGVRTIVIPEAIFFTFFPCEWKDKIGIKTRRAHHLLSILAKCLKLLLRRKLLLPKKIVLPEIFLFLINPFVFVALVFVTFVFLLQYPILAPFFILPFILPKVRTYSVEIIQNDFVILLALIQVIMKKKHIIWHSTKNSRIIVDMDVLRNEGLI